MFTTWPIEQCSHVCGSGLLFKRRLFIFSSKSRGGRWGGQVMTSLSWVIGAQVATGRGAWGPALSEWASLQGCPRSGWWEGRCKGTRGPGLGGAQMQRWGNYCWHAVRWGAHILLTVPMPSALQIHRPSVHAPQLPLKAENYSRNLRELSSLWRGLCKSVCNLDLPSDVANGFVLW